jgi:hypothetical protein
MNCACGMHAPGGVLFLFLKLAFVDLKSTLCNLDLGKCRGLNTVSGVGLRGLRVLKIYSAARILVLFVWATQNSYLPKLMGFDVTKTLSVLSSRLN